MGLSISLEQNGDKHILRLEGRIDDLTSATLGNEIDALYEAQHRKVLLDFARVEHLSLHSLQMLLLKTKKFTGDGRNLGLCNISSSLLQSIERFPLLIYRDEQEALKAMA